MDDISQMRKGRLMIGSLPITGAHICPHVLPVFQQKYPEIEIAARRGALHRIWSS